MRPLADLHDELDHHIALAWCAGVIDVSGALLLDERTVPGTRLPHHTLTPRLVVVSQPRPARGVYLKLQDEFGGSVSGIRNAPRRRVGWRLSGAKACLTAIDALLPYLATKRELAAAFRAYCDRVVSYKSDVFPAVVTDDEVRGRRLLELEFRLAFSRLQSRR